MFMLLLIICSSSTYNTTDSFSPFIFLFSRNFLILGNFKCHHPLWDSKGTSDSLGEEIFDWVIFSDLLLLNEPDIPTLLYRFSLVIFFVLFLAFSCSWEVLQHLVSDHLPITPTAPLSPVFRPNQPSSSFNI